MFCSPLDIYITVNQRAGNFGCRFVDFEHGADWSESCEMDSKFSAPSPPPDPAFPGKQTSRLLWDRGTVPLSHLCPTWDGWDRGTVPLSHLCPTWDKGTSGTEGRFLCPKPLSQSRSAWALTRFSELLLKISTCAKILTRFSPNMSYIYDICPFTTPFSGENRAFSSHNRKFLAITLKNASGLMHMAYGELLATMVCPTTHPPSHGAVEAPGCFNSTMPETVTLLVTICSFLSLYCSMAIDRTLAYAKVLRLVFGASTSNISSNVNRERPER